MLLIYQPAAHGNVQSQRDWKTEVLAAGVVPWNLSNNSTYWWAKENQPFLILETALSLSLSLSKSHVSNKWCHRTVHFSQQLCEAFEWFHTYIVNHGIVLVAVVYCCYPAYFELGPFLIFTQSLLTGMSPSIWVLDTVRSSCLAISYSWTLNNWLMKTGVRVTTVDPCHKELHRGGRTQCRTLKTSRG